MSRYVKENFPKAKMVEPEGTYLVWVDFSGYGFSNEELEHLMLEEAKLWLDSGIIFGPETAQFERFNVACPRVMVEQALTQLKMHWISIWQRNKTDLSGYILRLRGKEMEKQKKI